MTGLIISVPTLAAAIWQGNMGTLMAYSAFDRGGGASPGPQGQPAGFIPQQNTRNSVTPSNDVVSGSNANLARMPDQGSVSQLSDTVGWLCPKIVTSAK
jgi:type IV secretion system protein VirB6